LVDSAILGPESAGRKPQGEEMPSARLKAEKLFAKNPATLSSKFAASANRRFEFHERGQLLIRTRNERLSVVAMGVFNPDCSETQLQMEKISLAQYS
jgi:hypothetical protein